MSAFYPPTPRTRPQPGHSPSCLAGFYCCQLPNARLEIVFLYFSIQVRVQITINSAYSELNLARHADSVCVPLRMQGVGTEELSQRLAR